MGVTYLFCPRCNECGHEDYFKQCASCYERLTDHLAECNHGYLCDQCDEDYAYEHKYDKFRYKWIHPCDRCNPNFYKGTKKQQKKGIKDIGD